MKLKSLSGVIGFACIATPSFAQGTNPEKLNAYIECYNGANGRAIDSINRYQSWVKDMEKGPTGKEKHVYGLYELHDHEIAKCKEIVPPAIALQPASESLDKVAQAYLDKLLALNEKVIEANKYYDRENYKDDGFAKGKEMHGPLAAAMKEFLTAEEAFSAALDEENDGALKAQLAEMEAAGQKNLDYWTLSTVIKAKEVSKVMSEETFDVEAAAKLVSAYEDSADGLNKYASEHKDEWAKADPRDRAAEAFRKAAKERLRRVRDNKPYSKGEQMNLNPSSGWMVEGSSYKLQRYFNELIDAANR